MKRAISLILALILILSTATALAAKKKKSAQTTIDGVTERKIKFKRAKVNEDPLVVIGSGYSPTTGRKLSEIEWEDGFSGAAVNGIYQPMMVQTSMSGNGVYDTDGTNPYRLGPVNGSYADVVYEAIQKRDSKGNGLEIRWSMLYSDTVPDFVGYLRSTRLTHVRIRQEWECALCTSGYHRKDVPPELTKLGVKNPSDKARTEKDPGIIYVGDVGTGKPWKKYVLRINDYKSPNNEVFQLSNIQLNVIPKDHVAANHTWLFTDEIPEDGDTANVVYVTYGNAKETDSKLEYDASTNSYIRYVTYPKKEPIAMMDTKPVNPTVKKAEYKVYLGDLKPNPNRVISFNNVIVQYIKMNWISNLRPDPEMTGTGNADYFMCGRHYAGVWDRKDINSRTVFYGADGKEIKMQRGRTLIIVMPCQEKNNSAKKYTKSKYTVKYE